jgi:cellulose synthase (UDP-forming)
MGQPFSSKQHTGNGRITGYDYPLNHMNLPHKQPESQHEAFLETKVSKKLIVFNVILAIIYFLAIAVWSPRGNSYLFWILIAGEVFHLWQLITYLYTIWNTEYMPPLNESFQPPVDVFITVAGEPADIVADTIRAALRMEYPKFTVYVLNDSFVAKKDNWQEIETMALRLGARCITRTKPGGAKAGNINNAVRQTLSPFFAVFDADHIPHRDFLQKTMGYFGDPKMGYVQSPQYYKNAELNSVAKGSWEQQALFFGAICKGKNRLNAVTMCGTNMVIRREALEEVGGICDYSIAEDFVTGVWLHEKGWKSCYVPEILAEGLAPEDFLSYYKQQFRWARGSMDVLFKHGFIFKRGLTWQQKVQYLSSVSYFLSGLVVLMNALIPVIFLYTGLVPLNITTMGLASIFLPYIFVTIFTLQVSTNFSYSFKSLAFSMAGFHIHISALWANIINKKSSFSVTSKRALSGNFLNLVIPHMLYVLVVAAGIAVAIMRDGVSASVITNFAWAFLNVAIFLEFVGAALPQKAVSESKVPAESREQAVVESAI